MENERFLIQAKSCVVTASAFEGIYETDHEDLYIVWFAKTLGNWKALISTDKYNGQYWEVTYNGAKQEAYVDRYVKASNIAIADSDLYGVPAPKEL